MDSILGPCFFLDINSTLEYFDDWKIKFLCKFPVTGIVGGNGHDGAGTVADQYIVSNPDGDFLSVHWVDCITTTENTGLVFCQIGAL